MKKIELEQGSPEWLSWRKTVITATDASIIMGNNPWTTPYACWQRKLGLVEDQKSNEAMERGKRLEPAAREQFIQLYGIDMTPMVVESTEFDFLGASLDGFSERDNTILEIKCGGAKLHSMASHGEIPEYYKDQMQHQMLVTAASKCFYYSYDGKNGICIEVFPDPEFRKTFIPKAREFWKCVALHEAPALQDSDYQDMSNESDWNHFSFLYKSACEQIKILEQSKENYRRELLTLCGDKNCRGGGIKVMKTTLRGRVDYDSIPEIQGVNLDKYRKESTSCWKILLT